jgi:MinD-like ATPase involved in chromosome partitioning or flagellar assembly
VLIACWSVKGGSGTTVVSAALASVIARTTEREVVLADLGGDCPAVLGLPEPSGPGIAEWLVAADATATALRRLEVEAAPGVFLLPRGEGALPTDGGDRLVAALAADIRPVVVDCGPANAPLALAVASVSSLSLLVLRPCYLALRRALAAPLRPSGVILVVERNRSLSRRDVEDVLGVPVRAQIAWDPQVARAVDAGLLSTRLPRGLDRALRAAA